MLSVGLQDGVVLVAALEMRLLLLVADYRCVGSFTVGTYDSISTVKGNSIVLGELRGNRGPSRVC